MTDLLAARWSWWTARPSWRSGLRPFLAPPPSPPPRGRLLLLRRVVLAVCAAAVSAGLIGGVAAATGRGEPRVEAVRAPDELKLTYLAAGVGTVRPVAPVEVEPLAPAPEVVAAPSVPQRASRVAVAPAKRTWSGYASWYGNELAGNRTANGEVFDPNALTAAHRTLPFGSRVRVTNPRNGRSVEVRINDRGPHVAGREIDLSRAAAEAIGVRARGGGTVTLELL